MTAQQPTARDEVADSHGPILKRYRREVQDVFGDLSVQGLPETRHNIGRLRLDQIYIRLNLELQAGSAERAEILNRFYDINSELTDFEAHAEERKDEGEIGARIQAECQLVLRNEADILARTTTKSEPLDLAQAMIESRHLIVLGAPGSGKTTMTRWLALTFAQDLQAQPDRLGHAFKGSQLPVVVELGRLARWIKDPARWPGAEGLAPQLARFIADDPRFDGDIMAPIERVIEEGPCLLLFDGLDEVANLTLRRRIAESIQALARADQSSNLVLVTSRPSGFRDVDLGPTFRVGEVQPFTPEDVRRFVGQWYAMAYGQRYRHEAEALVREIEGKDRIAALAENPLLCSVIAVVHRRSGQLPNRRVDLYEECCKVLLETWDDARDVERPIVLEGLDWSSKLLLLGELAFWMHEHAEEAHVGRNEVVAQLRPPLAKLRQVSEAEAGIDAEIL